MSVLGLSEEQLRSLPDGLREEVTRKYAKIEATTLMDGQTILMRDSSRLHRKAEAVYKSLGLTLEPDRDTISIVADSITAPSKESLMGSDEDDRDVRIVCDNLTIGDLPKKAEPQPTVQPEPEKPKRKWWEYLYWAAVLAIGAGIIGMLAYLAITRPAFEDTDTSNVIITIPEEE